MEFWLFLRVISRRKWLIIGLISLTLIATIVSNILVPIPVDAKTSILFNFRTPQNVDVFADKGLLTGKDPVENYNFVTLFASTSVLEEALAEASKKIDLGPVDLKTLKDSSEASLNIIKVGGKDEQTSIVEFKVTLKEKERAIVLCEAVSEVAIRRYKSILTSSVVKNREYIEQQVTVSEQDLDNAQAALEKFYIENPEFTRYLNNSTYTGETVQSESNVIDMDVKLASLNSQMSSVQKEMADYRKNPSDNMPSSIQASLLINDLRNQLVNMELDRDKLMTRYSDEYPQVKKLTGDIEEIRGTLHTTYLTLMNEKLESLKAERDSILSGKGKMESVQVQNSNDYNAYSIKRLQYDGLVRDLTVAENSYNLMTEKLSEAKIREDEAKNQYTLEIIDKPDKAMEKQDFYYNPVFKLVFAFFGSVIFSLLLVFLMDYFEVRYRSTTDISAVINLPILGEIPEYQKGK